MNVLKLKTNQDITKYRQKVAVNKDGSVRRTNRNKLAIGMAISLAKKGECVMVISPFSPSELQKDHAEPC